MVRIIETHNMIFLPSNGEAERLADIYVSEGIIPAKYITDAVHIATATV